MNFSPFSRILGPRDEYGNLVLPPRTISGVSSTLEALPTPLLRLPRVLALKFTTGLRALEGIREDFLIALPREGIEMHLGPPVVEPLRVLVIGSGIAGLSCAIACARQNFAVTVLERSTIRNNFGDSIILGSNASLLFHRWGILDDMSERSTKNKDWIVNDSTGKELHREDVFSIAEKFGSPLLQGKRNAFTCIMDHEARRLGVDFRYDAEVTGYSDSQIQPGVMLRGGEMVRGDVVIVCDGAKSSARRLMADDESVSTPRQPSGYAIHRAIISSKEIKNDPSCSYLADGNIRFFLGENCHAEIWPLDNASQLAFTFTYLDSNNSSTLNWRSTTPISTCLRMMKGWDPTLIAAVAKFSRTHCWTLLEDSVEPSWVSKGRRIVFAGDAVHPLSPASFQAGTQAVEDGSTLALCLSLAGAKPEKVSLALRVYERLRSARAERAGELGRQQQQLLHTFVSRINSQDPEQPPLDPTLSPRPLNFEPYSFDADEFAISNFEQVAKEIEAEEQKKSPSKGGFTSRYFAETF
ncbi:hypothetical protein JCM3765_006048 [Sporobolomyces pararoseus]